MINLNDRLSSLKQQYDTQVTSEDKSPTPLWVFLYIYMKTQDRCYINYMKGAKTLAYYLAPIDIPSTSTKNNNWTVPDFYSTYETMQLAELLTPTYIGEQIESKLTRLAETEKAILLCMINEVLPRLANGI